MTTNHGLYTDTVWAVPVTFRDTAGSTISCGGGFKGTTNFAGGSGKQGIVILTYLAA